MAAVPTTPAPPVAGAGPADAGSAGSGAPGPSESAAPPVVAVVVTCDPGWWLEECLASLAAQDYPELSVLVVDADSHDDPTARVAAVMPGAFVRRVRRRRGFGAAANEVLGVVEGASHFVFCHDDVALAPGAVRHLVEEAFRSNAGVVAPKLVGWFEPDRLLAAGMGADHFGVPVALVERGELDQEQHDAVRDVFFAPAACALVRADLFATLGGFDQAYGQVGEDLDLSWRAHVAGARVVFAPGARVRHLEATEAGQRALTGDLRASGADAAARAAEAGFATAVFPEDEELALAPSSLGAEVSHPDGGAEVAGGDETPAPWDLSRWDEEEAAEATAAASAARDAGHHASWRARRDAERITSGDTWSGDDDDDWDDSWSSRRRARKVAAARTRQAGRDASRERSGLRRRGERPVAAERRRGPDADELDDRRAEARLRAVATITGRSRLWVRLPLLLLLTVVEAVVRLMGKGPAEARRALRPWAALVRQSGAIRRRRRAVRSLRAVSDREATALQVTGTSRLRQALRTAAARESGAEVDGERVPDREQRWLALGAVVVAGVLVAGTRRLTGGHLPTIGEFGPWPGVSTLARHAASGWQPAGLGSSGPAPVALALLAVAGAVVLGHTTLLQHVLVLGMVPLGAVGVAHLVRPFPSRRAPLAAVVAYLVNPLPYNALATGRWSGLLAYGATPWALALVVRGAGLTEFIPAPARRRAPGVAAATVGVGLVGALVASVAPGYLLTLVIFGLALAGGLALGGRRGAAGRAAAIAAGGALVAAVLLAPWSASWRGWATFSGSATDVAHPLHLSALLRFQTGPLGAGVLGYALLVAAALPLVIGRGWRAPWGVTMWLVAMAGWASAWAGQHRALGLGWPPLDVVLAPAAVALAVAVALGVTAFDLDLPGYTFGWRQVVSAVAAAAALVACVPVVVAAGDGRWRQPRAGFDTVLSWMQEKRADGDFRVLWLGGGDVLPLPGWRLDARTEFAMSRNGAPSLVDQWAASRPGGAGVTVQALDLARHGETTALGHLLAPMGVRYIAVVERSVPIDSGGAGSRRVAADLHTGLESQLDLRRVDRSDSLSVYENDAWAATRIGLPDGAVAAAQSGDWRSAAQADLHGAPPVLRDGHGPASFHGQVPAGADVEVAEAPSTHWRLEVGGQPAQRQTGFGTVNLFTTAAGGPARLSYQTPVGWTVARLVELVLWVAALGFVLVSRRRRRPATAADAAAEVER